MKRLDYAIVLPEKVELLSVLILVVMLFIIPIKKSYALSSSKPNIVLIFIDDWAWNGTPIEMMEGRSNSAMPILQMPNLQTMRNNGMKFSQAYSGAPQCSPSRAALQTGQSAPHNGYTVFMNSGGSDYYDNSKNYSKFPVTACVSDMYLDADEYSIAKF